MNKKKNIHSNVLLQKFLILFFAVLYLFFFKLEFVYAETKGVQVTPTRIVFEGRKRVAKFRIINTNDQPCNYRISLISIQMDDYGTSTEVKNLTSNDIATQKMIRFSPRRTTLLPGEWQTVRLMVRKPRKLADGEYRVHMRFAPVPDFQNSQTNKQDKDGISIKINYVVNVSIPIIIRQGAKGFMKIIPNKPVLKTSKKTGSLFLEIELTRKGIYSFYGDIIVYHTKSNGLKPKQLGSLKGLSIYTPNKKQIIKIPVSNQDSTLLSNGKIKIEVLNREKKGIPIISSESFNLNTP